MKKILSITIALIMAFSCMQTAFAGDQQIQEKSGGKIAHTKSDVLIDSNSFPDTLY